MPQATRSATSSVPLNQGQHMPRSILAALLLALLTFCMSSGCLETYDSPPESYIELPAEGAFSSGKSVTVFFSEPIDVSTLRLQVWPNSLNKEREFPESLEPVIPSCKPSDCGEQLKVTLADDAMSMDLEFDPRSLGRPGETVILELMEGLEDTSGNDTGAPQRHPMSFRFDDTVRINQQNVVFDNGVYVLVGGIKKPIPATFNFVGEVRVSEEGYFAMAVSEATHIEGAPRNTSNPDELYFNDNPEAFATHITGFVFNSGTERLIVTDPVEISISISGINATLKGVRLNGKIIRNQLTGKDRIESSLSYEEMVVTLGRNTQTYDADTTPLNGDWTEPARVPEGSPMVCDSPCGYIVSEGRCDLPDGFPSNELSKFDRDDICED